MTKQKYIVMVDDNFHFMDESERYKAGEYGTYDEAVLKCKEIVDDYLLSALEPNMTAEQLYTSYLMYGENPFVSGGMEPVFVASAYAKQRCSSVTKTI